MATSTFRLVLSRVSTKGTCGDTMITLTPEPMRAPLPPQTRYDYPINKLQSYLLQAVFWLPMAYDLYGIRVHIINGPAAIPLFCIAWLVGMSGLVTA